MPLSGSLVLSTESSSSLSIPTGGGKINPAAAATVGGRKRGRTLVTKNQHSTTVSAQILEYTSYLEYYLWPHFHGACSFEHVMSIILVSNTD